MMPPPLQVCNGLASPADTACRVYCEICEVIRYAAALVWRRLEFSVVSCSLVYWYNCSKNVTSSSIAGNDYLPQSKSVQYSGRDLVIIAPAIRLIGRHTACFLSSFTYLLYSYEAKNADDVGTVHRDNRTVIGTPGHSENISQPPPPIVWSQKKSFKKHIGWSH